MGWMIAGNSEFVVLKKMIKCSAHSAAPKRYLRSAGETVQIVGQSHGWGAQERFALT